MEQTSKRKIQPSLGLKDIIRYAKIEKELNTASLALGIVRFQKEEEGKSMIKKIDKRISEVRGGKTNHNEFEKAPLIRGLQNVKKTINSQIELMKNQTQALDKKNVRIKMKL